MSDNSFDICKHLFLKTKKHIKMKKKINQNTETDLTACFLHFVIEAQSADHCANHAKVVGSISGNTC